LNWPDGYGFARYRELDSTNEEARRLARDGAQGPVWISAARQTAGRGRQGRVWQSLDGNLFATLLIRPSRGDSEWPQLSFAAAIAAADMAAGFAPEAHIAVKWPNDVLGNGRKLAGILLERVAGPGGIADGALAIGIGVNLAHHPDGTEFPAISLASLGVSPPGPDQALTALAAHFAKWYDQWQVQGFAGLREAWLARAAGLGAQVRARLAQEERVGVVEGIDDSGALLLNEGGTVRVISAGEVFF
jgi:BirA family biotin operon repressor/biotin-[acetyl-CoA-carboxylase] ligase